MSFILCCLCLFMQFSAQRFDLQSSHQQSSTNFVSNTFLQNLHFQNLILWFKKIFCRAPFRKEDKDSLETLVRDV